MNSIKSSGPIFVAGLTALCLPWPPWLPWPVTTLTTLTLTKKLWCQVVFNHLQIGLSPSWFTKLLSKVILSMWLLLQSIELCCISALIRTISYKHIVCRCMQYVQCQVCSMQYTVCTVPNWVPFRVPGSPWGPFCGFGPCLVSFFVPRSPFSPFWAKERVKTYPLLSIWHF